MNDLPIGPNPCGYCGGEYGGHEHDCPDGGMPDEPEKTLRDEFAMSALQGLLAAEANSKAMGFPIPNAPNGGADEFAISAYQLADAMLAARQKGEAR